MLGRAWSGVAILAVTAAVALLPATAFAASSAPAGQAVADSSLASSVLTEINAVRRSHGLTALRFSPALASAARQHSESMALKGYFSHNSADGSEFWRRVKAYYGQGSYGLWSVGENLLWSSPDLDPAGALQMWMNSAPHRENLLTARWREVGISAVHVAAAPGTFNGLDVTIVTADFGVRS